MIFQPLHFEHQGDFKAYSYPQFSWATLGFKVSLCPSCATTLWKGFCCILAADERQMRSGFDVMITQKSTITVSNYMIPGKKKNVGDCHITFSIINNIYIYIYCYISISLSFLGCFHDCLWITTCRRVMTCRVCWPFFSEFFGVVSWGSAFWWVRSCSLGAASWSALRNVPGLLTSWQLSNFNRNGDSTYSTPTN